MWSSSSVKSWFLVSLLAVVWIALLVPPAVSGGADKKEEEESVIKVAASCTTKCRDLCAALPKSEDPNCDRRCNNMWTAFNGSVRDHTALAPQTAFDAVQEMHLCSTGCFLRCNPTATDGDAASRISCQDKCANTFRRFGPAVTVFRNTMAANGLPAPVTSPLAALGKDDFKFGACLNACNGKCAATSATKLQACGGSCAEACHLYNGAIMELHAAMPPAAVPSPAALGDDPVANTFKACNQHCAANDNKCAITCSYACYLVSKAKASMKLASGSYGLPA